MANTARDVYKRIGTMRTIIFAGICLGLFADCQCQRPGCWWTGCQPNTWAVRGCESGMEKVNETKCENPEEDKFHCCPSDKKPTATPTEGKICWWTSCESKDWAERGCPGTTDQVGTEVCKNDQGEGDRYQCCEKDSGENPADKYKPPLSCWWSGCQPYDWAVRGCPNTTAQADTKICPDGKPGDIYQCCEIPPENIVGGREEDHGFGDYQNYVKYLLLRATAFSAQATRLPCTAVDPEKKYIVGVGEDEGIRICDLCPNLPFSKLQDVLINNYPMTQTGNVNFAECFGFCMDVDNCVALSYDQIEKICYIYNTTYGQFASQGNWTTVLINQPVGTVQQWVYSRHTKITGKEMKTVEIRPPSFLKCLETCENTVQCSQVSYEFASSNCKLFDGIKEPGFFELEYGSVAALQVELAHDNSEVEWRYSQYTDNPDTDEDDEGTTTAITTKSCPKPSSPDLGIYFAKECVTSDSLGCDRATSCKTCYYPEKSNRIREDFTICPDSIVLTKEEKDNKRKSCLQKCFSSETCLAVDFDEKTLNCELLDYEKISQPAKSQRFFLQFPDGKNSTKNNLKGFSILLNHDLMPIAGSKAFFASTSSNDWNGCLKDCLMNERCVKASFSKKNKLCKLASNVVQVLDRRTDSTNDYNVFVKKPKLTSNEIAFKRTSGWFMGPKDAKETSQDSCSSDECSGIVSKCLGNCLTKYNEWCGFVSVEYYVDKVICHYFVDTLNGTLEANSQREIFTRFFNNRFDLHALNNLSIFESQDMYTCFEGDDGQTQESLNGFQNPYETNNDDDSNETRTKRALRVRRGIFDGIKKFFKKVGEGIKNFVVDTAKKIKDTAVGVVKTVSNVVQGKFDKAKESFLNIPIVKSVKEAGENVVKLGKSIVKGDWEGVKDAGLGLVTSDVLDFVPGGKVLSTGGKILKGITKGGAKGAKDKAGKQVKDKVDNKVNNDRDANKQKDKNKDKDDNKKEEDRPGSECKTDGRSKRQANLGKRKRPGNNQQCNNNNQPKCTRPGPNIQNVMEHSLSNCHLKTVNSKCSYECDAGYSESPNQVACQRVGNNARWNPPVKCNPETCGVPPFRIIPVKVPPPLLNVRFTGNMVAYVSFFDQKRKLPVWTIAVHDKLNTVPVTKREKSFFRHPCLTNTQQAQRSDYSGDWDQGHLTPANVMLFTRKTAMASNLYINVAPQDGFTNKGYWKVIEGHVACYTKRVSALVVTGVCPGKTALTVGRLDVPDCFWKMICYKDSSKGKTFVVGFMADNSKIGKNKKDREDRRAQLKVPVSQSDIKLRLASNPAYGGSDPWVQSSPYIFSGRPGVPPVNPVSCSAAQALDPNEANEWKKAIAGTGKKKGKREASGEPRGCTPDEAREMALLLGIGTMGLDDFTDEDLAPGEEVGEDDDYDDGPIADGGSLVPAAACGKRVIGYYPSWGKNKFTPTQAQRLTHVIFAFLEMKPDGTILVGNPDLANSKNPEEDVATAKDRLQQMLRVAKAFSHLKILFAVGGWENSQYFSAVASSQSGRLKFIASVIKNIDEHGFDGVDVDWEYPVTGGAHEGVPADKQNYVQLMKELREALTEHAKVMQRKQSFLISFAGAAGQWTLDPGFDLPGILKYADFANVMTYDFFGAWESKWGAYTGPPAPLFFGMPPRYSGKTNADWTMKYYVCRSQQPHKINMGVPFYGRYWKNVGDPVDGKDGCWRTAQAVNGKFEGGYVGWRDIKSKYLPDNSFEKFFHEKAKAPYAFNAGSKTYLGYEDTKSLKIKAEYAAQKNLGGIMIWAIDQDDDDFSMLNSVYGAKLCDNTNPKDIKHKCSPITEKRWWTTEDGEDVAGLCGRSAPLYKGFYPVCDPDDPGYSCCGEFGYCGSGDKFCNCPACVDFGTDPQKILTEPVKPTIPVAWYFLNAEDGKRGRCGRKAPLLNGAYPICNPDDPNAHCCSNGNYCGSSKEFCECEGCIDFKKNPGYKFKPKRWWDWSDGEKLSGKCGPNAPKVDGHMAECDPDTKYYCCSTQGNCGEGPDFCDCKGCVNYKK